MGREKQTPCIDRREFLLCIPTWIPSSAGWFPDIEKDNIQVNYEETGVVPAIQGARFLASKGKASVCE